MTFIVVGVSASSGSPGALRMAARESKLRKIPLIAVQAWSAPRAPSAPGGRPPAVSVDPAQLFANAEQALRDQVAETLPEEVECRLVKGSPGKVLLSESEGAELLVVDAPRGAITPTSPLLAHKLVYQTSCPVLIMPPSQAQAG
ncbi:nucleotide-binding universal stress UspA family protein [Psychromicrobium silvestre]|uniref:Nucleotide-binding universal stress UspA family protein n=1 Tax=Psychromicrobium silvestre TaxID=1645614 RepID=A0A7Y9LU04_9MICC|nr:universal stress protein [Psychromicrobium silvestre]NYE95520.1 nucleotide-binding universal stress UspA family protein [Psychromicrobium silvestre]